MPERQIPWRWVAENVAGSLSVETGLQSSRFQIVGSVSGMRLHIDGSSTPYTSFADSTRLRLVPRESLGAKINLYRNSANVPLYQRFLRRDVVIGDVAFDEGWIINAQRESQAQAFLGPEQQAVLDAVPASAVRPWGGPNADTSYYEFGVRDKEVNAHAAEFEGDADRLMTVVEALVALALRPRMLMQEYKELAKSLGGTLHGPSAFSLDGRLQLRFATGGRALSLSPIAVQTGWRRDRLRTRITCEHVSRSSAKKLELSGESNLDGLVADLRLAEQAMAAADMVAAKLSSSHVSIDLEGQVTDVERLRAAAYLATSLSQGPTGSEGPYR